MTGVGRATCPGMAAPGAWLGAAGRSGGVAGNAAGALGGVAVAGEGGVAAGVERGGRAAGEGAAAADGVGAILGAAGGAEPTPGIGLGAAVVDSPTKRFTWSMTAWVSNGLAIWASAPTLRARFSSTGSALEPIKMIFDP
ncbi:MAG: hypothetical protein AAGJ56_10005 [Myxococcota bacterium]